MKHRRIPIKIVREGKFTKARAAKERAPVWQCGHALPAVFRGKGSDIHPVSRWHFTIFPALLINFRVKVVACR